jgi:hypothetical protein
MATTVTNTSPGAYTNVLTTGLNSLADAGTQTSGVIASDGKLTLRVAVNLASMTPGTGGSVQVHLLLDSDGTNYADLVSSNSTSLIGVGVVSSGASVKRFVVEWPQPPGNYKIAVISNLGAAMAASGNTVAYTTFTQTAA